MPLARMSLKGIIYNIIVIGIILYKTFRRVVPDATMPLAKMSLKGIIYNIIVIGIILYKTFRRACPRCHHAPCQNVLKRNNI